MRKLLIFVLLSLFLIIPLLTETNQNIIIKGVKIYKYEGDLNKLFTEFHNLGINMVLVGEELAKNRDFYKTAKKFNIKTFIVFPVFCNPEKPFKKKKYYAIDGYGQIARSEWVNFACPSNLEYRRKKLSELKSLIKEYNPDGISIDFIRYFVYWEKVKPNQILDPLKNTCFCDNSIRKFANDKGLKLPNNFKTTTDKAKWILKYHKTEWVEWKTEVIASMVKDITQTAKKINPDLLFNIHIIPWREKDFNNGIKVIAGQDIKKLSKYVDYISPMCYWHMVKRPVEWINSVVKDMARFTDKPIIPSIQVSKEYLKTNISYKLFQKARDSALKTPSNGVIFWKWGFFEQQPNKKKILIDNF